jgi:preprotein translocase subunit YajC
VGDVASLVLPLGAFVLIFWLLIIRPQARRQRELSAMQEALSVGDRIMLTSGIHGTVAGLEDDVAVVEIADGVRVRVARGAVGRLAEAVPQHTEPPTERRVDEENE